jgi:hypothetical protein
MSLITRPKMRVAETFDDREYRPVPSRNHVEYHLCFVNSDASPRYARKVVMFLDEIFSNTNGTPLDYEQHVQSYENGTLCALVSIFLLNLPYGSGYLLT